MHTINKQTTINISAQFSRYPGGRLISDGKFSGQRFREQFLVPALNENDGVEVLLDGTLGYGSSFLEEAFGGLIRVEGFDFDEIDHKLVLTSSNDALAHIIKSYLKEAAEEKRKAA